MTIKDWTIRNKDGVAIVRVEGQDYTEIPGSTEGYPAAYPDSVANAIQEHGENGTIKVVLGHIRYFLMEDGSIDERKPVPPQTVWLKPIKKDTKLDVAEESKDEGSEGFVTG